MNAHRVQSRWKALPTCIFSMNTSPTNRRQDLRSYRVEAVRALALDVRQVDLTPSGHPGGSKVEAGSHVDVHLPNGLVRQYSLINEGETERFRIAVGLDAKSRGGSAYVHQKLAVGDVLQISQPRNNFPLADAAAPVVLFAGGIGITPIWCMVQALEKAGRPWTLYYSARTESHAAFIPVMRQLAHASAIGRLVCHFDDREAGIFDLRGALGAHMGAGDFYCCGPAPMIAAFEQTATGLGIPSPQVHVEHFGAAPHAVSGEQFEVETADGVVYEVPPDRTILEVLEDAGVCLMYSCRQGLCGTCETKVLDGEPLHLDSILSDSEKMANKTMMICVSRARSARLKLGI